MKGASVYLRTVRVDRWLWNQVPDALMIYELVSKSREHCSVMQLGLAICLRMVGSSCQMLQIDVAADGTEIFGYEVQSIIRWYVCGFAKWNDPKI